MKKFCSTVLIAFTILVSMTASPLFKASIGIEYSYDTNVFSNPLPLYEEPDQNGNFPWLTWKSNNPFIQRHSIGGNLSFDILFKETSRVGISTSLDFKYPLASKTIRPVPDDPAKGFGNTWHYEESNSLEDQKTAVFFGFGPVFMAQFKFMDLGCAIRMSLGGYSYTDREIIMGIQAEPFMHFHLPHNLYINVKLTYDAHLMRFINNETNDIFEPNYQMISASPSIGLGIKF